VNLATIFMQGEERVIPVPEPGERCLACDRWVPLEDDKSLTLSVRLGDNWILREELRAWFSKEDE
jgi:hypothetical protein